MIDEIAPEKLTRLIYGCDPGDIGETVVIVVDDGALRRLKEKVEVLKEFKGFLAGFTGRYEGRVFSGISLRGKIGSPEASEAAYFLRFTPCRNVIYTGAIGALKQSIRVGDIIMPTAAVRGEGASKYHVEEWYPAVASFELLRKAAPIAEETYSKLDVRVHYGVIHTTDSFAAETREFLEKLQKRHIIGIEMETSAIFAIANLQGMRVMAIHLVSDNPIVGKNLFETPSADDASRSKAADEALPGIILSIAADI